MGRKSEKKDKIANNYRGWPVDARASKKIDTIDADIDPETFWKNYISKRKPVRSSTHFFFSRSLRFM